MSEFVFGHFNLLRISTQTGRIKCVTSCQGTRYRLDFRFKMKEPSPTFCALVFLHDATGLHVFGLHAVCGRALVAQIKACCICGM